MSLKTWMEEFYPVEASADMTEIEMIDHALLKYKGTTKENLDKHGVKMHIHSDYAGTVLAEKDAIISHVSKFFVFNIDQCSYCRKYFCDDCIGCPLYEHGDGCCEKGSSYFEFLNTGDSTRIRNSLNAIKEELIDRD